MWQTTLQRNMVSGNCLSSPGLGPQSATKSQRLPQRFSRSSLLEQSQLSFLRRLVAAADVRQDTLSSTTATGKDSIIGLTLKLQKTNSKSFELVCLVFDESPISGKRKRIGKPNALKQQLAKSLVHLQPLYY